MTSTSRRDLLGHGCAALLLAAAGLPGVAAASTAAPRSRCPHAGCRHHRDGDRCGLAIRAAAVVLPDEPLPTDAAVILSPPVEPSDPELELP